ncbi:MAG: hypothetical protein ACTHPS_14105 [Streptosporangiaceae bacterium]
MADQGRVRKAPRGDLKQITLRVPLAFHQRLEQLAVHQHRSLHGQVIYMLERQLAVAEREEARRKT